jgi:hypothetical protein
LETLINLDAGFPQQPIYVCASNGNPNDIPHDFQTNCKPPLDGEVRLLGDTIVYSFELKDLDATSTHPFPNVTLPQPIGKGKEIGDGSKHHFSTLLAGRNYGLCTIIDPKTTNCLRFSVHMPFFYFPHYVPRKSADNYTDPDPYVLIDDRAAIFGVVDPDLGSQVGILNFGWQNDADGLTSKVSAEDPADALQQQLDYFDRQLQLHGKSFTGLKILLAQTTPQRAKVLAAKFPEFQIVLSEADLEQATSETEMKTVWKPNEKAGA